MKLKNGTTLHNSNVGSSSLFTFHSVLISKFEERSEVPRVGDIWIPKAFASLDCFIKFFIQGIKNLLQEGDMILRVEDGEGMSRLISWKLYLKLNQGLNGNRRVQMNNHMSFRFLTCLIPWLKEDILSFLHKDVST
jgi:hypothetical protein